MQADQSPRTSSTQAGRYPRVLRFFEPARHGILLGPAREYRALSSWCRNMLPVQGTRLARIARILVTNAHQHSRSGLPGGTVRVVLDQTRLLLPHLYVTDQGPRNPDSLQFPQLHPGSSTSGLAVLNRLALSWTPSWTWDGNRIQQTTVEAVLDLN
ncbi:ATP-binding protein [Nocardiopsis sp. L17-MgMaSL7]|uniref:ATP-binding protein n=1 Tax=Nocardiopsis sp. L17-MgMaSL7 TaxID=1938893 RepID=UPI000D8A6AB3|nr:ATP-binding protein [Nocardiopsis sp. L17-MgMaSL7]PWV58024.1 hypothetical protein BDW27_101259 [Nocardiopsis sp. L17-MgMaSL7]